MGNKFSSQFPPQGARTGIKYPKNGHKGTKKSTVHSSQFLTLLLAACCLLLSFPAYARSPHKAKDGCPVCHVNPPASVKTKDAKELPEAKKLVKDPIALCEECHPDVHPTHKTGIKATMNRYNLPLDGEGRITCAYTCHNMHPEENSPHGRALLRDDVNTICLSCHDK